MKGSNAFADHPFTFFFFWSGELGEWNIQRNESQSHERFKGEARGAAKARRRGSAPSLSAGGGGKRHLREAGHRRRQAGTPSAARQQLGRRPRQQQARPPGPLLELSPRHSCSVRLLRLFCFVCLLGTHCRAPALNYGQLTSFRLPLSFAGARLLLLSSPRRRARQRE